MPRTPIVVIGRNGQLARELADLVWANADADGVATAPPRFARGPSYFATMSLGAFSFLPW